MEALTDEEQQSFDRFVRYSQSRYHRGFGYGGLATVAAVTLNYLLGRYTHQDYIGQGLIIAAACDVVVLYFSRSW